MKENIISIKLATNLQSKWWNN